MRDSKLFALFFAVIITAVASLPASAREAVLRMRDGRTMTGELVSQTEQSVTLSINGINATFARRQIQSMDVTLSVKEEYEKRRGELEDNDLPGRFELARWLSDRKTSEAYALALIELNGILQQDPSHLQAKLLRNVAQKEVVRLAQEQMQENQAQNAANVRPPVRDGQPRQPDAAPNDPDDPNSPQTETDPANPLPAADQTILVSDEDINVIKVYEINLDNRPNVVIPQEVIDELFERYREDPLMERFLARNGQLQFRRMQGYEQLGLIFDLRAREIYPKVTVRDEPEALQVYKQRIYQTLVIRYLARYFAQGDQPVIPLITNGATRDQVIYTNYLMLHGGLIDGKPLIDRSNPMDSLIIQWALPREEAKYPAPEVNGWRPYFSRTDDPRINEVIEWIGMLWGDTQSYPVQYELPASLSPAPASP